MVSIDVDVEMVGWIRRSGFGCMRFGCISKESRRQALLILTKGGENEGWYAALRRALLLVEIKQQFFYLGGILAQTDLQDELL
jgi:hypothetical protein